MGPEYIYGTLSALCMDDRSIDLLNFRRRSPKGQRARWTIPVRLHTAIYTGECCYITARTQEAVKLLEFVKYKSWCACYISNLYRFSIVCGRSITFDCLDSEINTLKFSVWPSTSLSMPKIIQMLLYISNSICKYIRSCASSCDDDIVFVLRSGTWSRSTIHSMFFDNKYYRTT